MKTSTKKAIIWTSVIAVIGVSGYLAYRHYKKNKDAEEAAAKKKEKIQDIATGIGGFISGLFGGKNKPQLTDEQESVLKYTSLNPLMR